MGRENKEPKLSEETIKKMEKLMNKWGNELNEDENSDNWIISLYDEEGHYVVMVHDTVKNHFKALLGSIEKEIDEREEIEMEDVRNGFRDNRMFG